MAKQQTRNDETRSGDTPTAYGMMTNPADRSRTDRGQDQAAGSVIDREGSTDPAVEQGTSGAQGSNRARSDATGGRNPGHNGNGSGNGHNRNGNGGRAEQPGGREGASMRSQEQGSDDRGQQDRAEGHGSAWGQQQHGGRQRQWRQSPQLARDVMTRNPRTVKPTDLVQQIAQLMVDEDTGIIPVVDGSRLVGVVTDRDIVCRLVAGGTDLKSAKASDVMTTEVECVTEDDSLQEVLEVMGDNQIRRVGVVGKDDRLVGIISMADLAREADVDRRLQETFEEISSQRSFWSKMR